MPSPTQSPRPIWRLATEKGLSNMFDISAETVTIVKSVTIRLTGEQVEQLVDALPAARGFLEPDTLPILDLLEQLNAIRNGHAADPVGATPRGRPAPPKKTERSLPGARPGPAAGAVRPGSADRRDRGHPGLPSHHHQQDDPGQRHPLRPPAEKAGPAGPSAAGPEPYPGARAWMRSLLDRDAPVTRSPAKALCPWSMQYDWERRR